MPSIKDPNAVVQPGPGLLPAGVVPASALLFVPGGGSSAALQAHINNPHDAHFASAIGINPYWPANSGTTQDPILTSVGGPVDGESVLDFINQFKALAPPRPNSIGFSAAAGGTGVPNWGALNALGVGSGTTVTGGYASAAGTGQPVTFTHFLAPSTVTTFSPTGVLFPADRGVVAFYLTTSGDYFDSANTTLVAALSLNDTPPAGVPNSAFNESFRDNQQSDYVPSGSGLDQFGLTFRLPYLTEYTPYPGTPFGPFGFTFPSYQLAVFTLNAQTIATGNSQSFLIIHWKETYAKTLASIQPASLTPGNLSTTNCYSAIPFTSFDDNSQPAYNVNRHNVFKDTNSATLPASALFSSSPNGTPTTTFLSGVQYYNTSSGAGALSWTLDLRATGLFANSFETGSVDNPPNVPTQYHSQFDPLQLDFTSFGGGLLLVPYNEMNKFGGAAYSNTNTPQPSDTSEYQNASLSIFSPTPFTFPGGFSQIIANLVKPFVERSVPDPNLYLFNSYTPGSISTTTFEPFVDELYRYLTSFDPTTSSTVPIIPTGGDIFSSSAPFASGGSDLQVVGQQLVYPQTNYDVANFFPSQTPNYSGFPSSDGAGHLRRYLRAVDTGMARNSGWLRLRGVLQATFQTNAAYNGTETTGHSGGIMIQIKIPGSSGTDWLDLGRQYGDPGIVGPLGTSPFYGCQTGVVVSGSDVYLNFNTGSNYTSNNGSGNFLLFVRITLINGSATHQVIDQFQWYPPTFGPP
jgi:hypothetical protein